jgi:hypothetical protein
MDENRRTSIMQRCTDMDIGALRSTNVREGGFYRVVGANLR